jgi:hypothetical protein
MSIKIIRSPKSKRFYSTRSKGFTVTVANATRFPSYDDAEEAMEDIGLLGKARAFAIIDAPEAKVAKRKAELAAAKAVKKLGVTSKDLKRKGAIQNKDGSSWAIHYTRGGGKRDNPAKLGVRRFATEREARHHADRMVELKGWAGYTVRQMAATPVNSWVNWKSGLTNPGVAKLKASLKTVLQ